MLRAMEDAPAVVLEALWELIASFGLCGSCHFSPTRDGGTDRDPWRCPRCGFLSCDDPETYGPVTRNFDPYGADEPRFASDFGPDEEEDEDGFEETLEPDFPVFDRRDKPITRSRRVVGRA